MADKRLGFGYLLKLSDIAYPFMYEVALWKEGSCRRELRSRDGTHIVVNSITAALPKRWERELNLAFERGLQLGLSIKIAADPKIENAPPERSVGPGMLSQEGLPAE